MRLDALVARLDDELRTAAFTEVDASPNGLQVGRAGGTVERAALAVDAAAETIDRAAEWDADVLVAHHGLVWGGLERLTGRTYDRLARLVEADLALYVSHLPLDAHPELGNAAGLADQLGLIDREPFGSLGAEHVGVAGRLAEPADRDGLEDVLASSLDHGEGGVRTLPFGPEPVESLAVVTGAGTDWLDEAADAGVDAFVTGEGKGRTYHAAKEAGLNVYLAGHYATETFGVRSLARLLEGWGVETTFIEAPTGL